MTGAAAILDALEGRYLKNLEAIAKALEGLRGEVAKMEDERDLLLRESAPILRRDRAAEGAGLSVSRVEQIIGGA